MGFDLDANRFRFMWLYAVRGGKYFRSVHWPFPLGMQISGRVADDMVELHELKPDDPGHQFWLHPAGGDFWYVVARDTGLVWSVHREAETYTREQLSNSLGYAAGHFCLRLRPFDGSDRQKFRFVEFVPSELGVLPYLKILPAFDPGLALDVKGGDSQTLIFFTNKPEADDSNQRFFLEPKDGIGMRALRPSTGDVLSLDVQQVPLLNDLQQKVPEELEPLLIGETYLPYWAVHDPDFKNNRREQSRLSPMYVMRREQLWTRTKSTINAPNSPMDVQVEFGMTDRARTTIEQTFRVELEGKGEAKYKALEGSLGVKASYELKLSQEHERTLENKRIEKRKVAGLERKHWRFAWWYVLDRYTIERRNGEVAVSWSVALDAKSVENQYPVTDD